MNFYPLEFASGGALRNFVQPDTQNAPARLPGAAVARILGGLIIAKRKFLPSERSFAG